MLALIVEKKMKKGSVSEVCLNTGAQIILHFLNHIINLDPNRDLREIPPCSSPWNSLFGGPKAPPLRHNTLRALTPRAPCWAWLDAGRFSYASIPDGGKTI